MTDVNAASFLQLVTNFDKFVLPYLQPFSCAGYAYENDCNDFDSCLRPVLRPVSPSGKAFVVCARTQIARQHAQVMVAIGASKFSSGCLLGLKGSQSRVLSFWLIATMSSYGWPVEKVNPATRPKAIKLKAHAAPTRNSI